MIDCFLTAYDPSDLPGGSVDPLGFERGYLFLADQILPGLTNVAGQPRYFSLLCLGIHLDRSEDGATPQMLLRNRRETVLRTERFWALANVLARGSSDAGGVRGVTYAAAQVDDLLRRKAAHANGKYRLLSRQAQYGALGMYGAVADGMRFINRDTLGLTQDLGVRAAEAFAHETSLPSAIRRAIIDDSDVALTTLRDWGERAYVRGHVGANEAECLNMALHLNLIRSRMAGWLQAHPQSGDGDELRRLARIAKAMTMSDRDGDLREALTVIIAYETCYRLAQLSLERILWVCRMGANPQVQIAGIASDAVITRVRNKLPQAVARLARSLNAWNSEGYRQNTDSLSDVREFLEQGAAAAATGAAQFLTTVLARHGEVQRGKFDHGRPKMPWLEWQSDGSIALTVSRVGGLRFAAERPEQIAAHPYRTGAADALIAASLRKSPYG
jgi:hypothetical protein